MPSDVSLDVERDGGGGGADKERRQDVPIDTAEGRVRTFARVVVNEDTQIISTVQCNAGQQNCLRAMRARHSCHARAPMKARHRNLPRLPICDRMRIPAFAARIARGPATNLF